MFFGNGLRKWASCSIYTSPYILGAVNMNTGPCFSCCVLNYEVEGLTQHLIRLIVLILKSRQNI